MKFAAVLLSLSILAGCIVGPAPIAYSQDVCTLNGVAVACYNPDAVIYPVYADAYIWDPVVGCFFFWGGGYRHYMGSGWSYGRGVPHGYWRGNRVYSGGGYHGGHEGHRGHR